MCLRACVCVCMRVCDTLTTTMYVHVHTIHSLSRLLSSQSDSGLESLWDNYIAVSQVTYNYSEPQEPSDYVT